MGFKMKGIKFDTGDKFVIDKSNIDGLGAIASKGINKGELIGTAVSNEESIRMKSGGIQVDARTRLGSILNHQDSGNAMQKSENNALNVYARQDIKEGEEITINYMDAPDYIDKSEVKNYKK